MGTRAIVDIYGEGEGEEDVVLCTLYRQFDGYPEGGLGDELVDFIKTKKVVNGHSHGSNEANGMGCLAAQLIGHLKNGVGNLYLFPPNTKDVWEEFRYRVRLHPGTGVVTVDCSEVDGDGNPEEWRSLY